MEKRKSSTAIRICSNCGSKKIKGIYLMSPTEKLMYQKNNNMLINAPENINYYACSECD